MKYSFFLTLLAFASLRCGSPEPSTAHALECYVRFDEPQTQLRAEATLYETIPNKRPVEPPGGIRYQRAAMPLLPVRGLTYQQSYAAAYVPEHLFEWKDAKGKPYAFTLQMPESMAECGFDSTVLRRDTPATFRWKGKALERGEVLIFIWENSASGQTIPVELYTVGSAPEVVFPAVKMAEIPAGKWDYYVVRKKLQKAQLDGASAQGVAEYYTKPRSVELR
jgi:hypothetical protein